MQSNINPDSVKSFFLKDSIDPKDALNQANQLVERLQFMLDNALIVRDKLRKDYQDYLKQELKTLE